tara:strand:+ start:5862 stop:7016 length:1155 start_codon:yes stop_codon:yes gene_type:complete
MPGHRPKFGDTLIPTLAKGIANIDSLAQAAIKAREAKDEREQQLAFAREESQKDRAFRQQQFEFNKNQADIKLMERLIDSVDEPYQKAAIAKRYGDFDLEKVYLTQDEKLTNQKDSLRDFYQLTEPKEVILGAASALGTLDPTSNAFSQVMQRRDEALESQRITHKKLMENTGFAARFNMIDTQLKSLGQKPEFYESALNRIDSLVAEYSSPTTPTGEGQGEKIGAALIADDQDVLSEAFLKTIPGVSLNLEDGTTIPEADETGSNIEQVATATLEQSTKDIRALQSMVKQLNTQVTNLNKIKGVGGLPKNGEQTLEYLTQALARTTDQLKEAEEIQRQSKILTEPYERESRRLAYKPPGDFKTVFEQTATDPFGIARTLNLDK